MAHGVPPEALYSVSLEQRLRANFPRRAAMAWTINVAGKGYRYETRLQAAGAAGLYKA